MFLGNYIITNHVVEQYNKRVKDKYFKDTRKCIKNDLKTLNIRNVIRVGEKIHVFTKGSKEFIFYAVERRNGVGEILILRTMIKRNIEDTRKIVEQRKLEKEQLETQLT